jgi:hypothetical protein
MARDLPATQKIVATGLTPAYTAPTANGDAIKPGQQAVHVKNASGASINVTVQTPQKVEGLDVAENIVAVPAGGEKMIGPFPTGTYARPSGGADVGMVYIDYSAVASVTRAILSF